MENVEIIAIHEAAHAIICLENKITFKKVSIIPIKNCDGALTLSDKFLSKLKNEIELSNPNQFKTVNAYLKCSIDSCSNATKDFEDAYNICCHLFGNTKTATAYLQYIICEVENSFRYMIDDDEQNSQDTDTWHLVIKLSKELLYKKELSYSFCKKIYSEFK